MGKDSAARIELGRSFHQMGTVNEKVSESDCVPLWDGTVMHRSLAERKNDYGYAELKSQCICSWSKFTRLT